MKTFKIVLGVALAIAVSVGLWACSNDEPAPDNPDVEVSEIVAALGDDYWVVTDTKIVAPDGQEYSNENEANLYLPCGILSMLGLRLDGTDLRLYTRVARFCYTDFSILKIDGKTMYLDDDDYNVIKLESADAGIIVVSYWGDSDMFETYYFNSEGDIESWEVVKGAYMKSTLRKAIPEEIEKMKNAIYVRDAYH